MTYLRRSGGVVGELQQPRRNTFWPTEPTNKGFLQEAFSMLPQELKSADCHVLQAESDADVPIAKTAVGNAAETP